MNLFKVPKTFDELKTYEKRTMKFVGPFYIFLSCFSVWSLWRRGIVMMYEKNIFHFSFLIFITCLFLFLGILGILYSNKVQHYERAMGLLDNRKKFFKIMRISLGLMGAGLLALLINNTYFIVAGIVLIIFIGAETLNYFFNRALENNFKETHES